MNSPAPRFTGLFIPAEILEHPDLTLLEQMLLAWIDALYSPQFGGCYARNDYLAQKMKVKENTIAKSLTKLRQLGLIEDVAFDGRTRVMRALIGRHVDQCQSKADLDLNPTQAWTKIQPRFGQKSNAIYKDNKQVYIQEEITPHTPHQKIAAPINEQVVPAGGNAAGAAQGDASFLDAKKAKRKASDFSPQVREVAEKMVTIVQRINPDYLPPKNFNPFLVEVDHLLNLDKRSPQRIYDVLAFALADYFHGPGLLTGNLAKKFREKFTTFSQKMKTPPPKTYEVDRRERNEDGTVVEKDFGGW
jgi:hypothetical protein